MDNKPDRIDENILAGYLSGDLPPRLRSEIAAYLATDDSALELLGMAGEALNAADPEAQSKRNKRSSRRNQRATPAPQYIRSSRATLFTITAVLLVLAGVYLVEQLVNYSSARPTEIQTVEISWSPVISTNRFGLSWASVEDASTYVVLIMDPTNEDLVSRIETTFSSIPNLLSAMDTEVPRAGQIMELWIAAFDDNGNLLRRSDRIPFSAGG